MEKDLIVKGEEIEKKLQVFRFGTLQDMLTILAYMEKVNLTLEDIEFYIKFVTERTEKQELINNNWQKRAKEMRELQLHWTERVDLCPECNKPLQLHKVIEPKGKRNIFGFRSCWRCPDEACSYEKYTKEIYEDLYHEVMKREEGR